MFLFKVVGDRPKNVAVLQYNGQPSGDFALWKALSQKWTGSQVSSAKQIAPNWGRLSTVKDFVSQVFLFSSSALPERSHFLLAVADRSCACTVPLSHLVVPFAWLCDGPARERSQFKKKKTTKSPLFLFFFLLGYFYFRSVP